MYATRWPHRPRRFPLLAAVLAAAALAGVAPPASAQIAPPAPGSTQSCVGVRGGFLLHMVGFGSRFPANTTGTTTFTFANGDVFTLTATTTDEGIFHTEPLVLDLRDPEIAALVGTTVHEVAEFGSVRASLTFAVYQCPAAPDQRVHCLEGGFESYPALGFLNQGDCVSWIATNGKNEPGKNQ